MQKLSQIVIYALSAIIFGMITFVNIRSGQFDMVGTLALLAALANLIMIVIELGKYRPAILIMALAYLIYILLAFFVFPSKEVTITFAAIFILAQGFTLYYHYSQHK